MNKMRSFLLLVLSLLTGCEATSELRGCVGGWIEFMCNYSTTTGQNQSFVIESPHLTTEDRRKNGCQKPFIQTAYRTAKTTIICDYPENKDKSRLKFFCKQTGDICEEILSTESSKRLNGRFTLRDNDRGFNISISNVSSDDAGVYWCGLKSNDKYHRAARKKIQLEVQGITNFTRSPTVGQNISYWCKYQTNNPPTDKFICKGEDPSICQHLVSTTQPNMDNGKFSMKDDTGKRNITITVRNLTTDDTGTYWCGAETTDKGRSNLFFNRLLMTVVPPPSTTEPPPVPTTQLTTASAQRHGGLERIIIVILCVAVLLLLLVLILILIRKRFSRSKNTKNEANAQHIREANIYEEIQECLQKPDTGNTTTIIYTTASFPMNPPASLHYSTINFQNSSDKGEARIPRPSSSICEYTTVKSIQSPADSPVVQRSRSTEDPLYTTVNKPQQQQPGGNISPDRKM
ncbi:CMRF35-like molecule 8 isoform X4 [Lates calcarifer]|uniref:CMRF35-like molecule 8 isoform X3 n=1 Tax=Lates calcarifer TaxID=8187 RepID=A0AAJ8BCC5_LATCA|nr:CMRF35-like molecule 8 isoform X3 [Lates calcarifer]XP_050930242.1 CMRF35-like molecule 8 isoform X4 [Lates calcarifer]